MVSPFFASPPQLKSSQPSEDFSIPPGTEYLENSISQYSSYMVHNNMIDIFLQGIFACYHFKRRDRCLRQMYGIVLAIKYQVK